MKIYNFLFDPDLNNLRLNMDASLVDPLEKGKNIELFDRDVILNLGKPIISAPIKKNIKPKIPTPKKPPPDYSRDIEAPKILHPMEKYTPEEFLKSHKLSKAKLNENLEKRNLIQKRKNDNKNDVNLGRVSVSLGGVEVSPRVLLRGRWGSKGRQ